MTDKPYYIHYHEEGKKAFEEGMKQMSDLVEKEIERLEWKEAQLEFYLMQFSRLEYETRIKDLSEEYTERHHVEDCIRLLNLKKRIKREVLRGVL